MTKRAATKRQTREHGILDSRDFMEESKVRRLHAPHNERHREGSGGWSPNPSNDDREQGYLKTLKPKSEGQIEMMEAIDTHNLVMALGPAGTGKTYLAVAKAVEALEAGKIGRIVLSRPAVEAVESIGLLSDVSARLEAVPDIAVVRLAERDIVRHQLVASVIGVL